MRRPTPRRCVPRDIDPPSRAPDRPFQQRLPPDSPFPCAIASQWDEGKGSHHPDYNPQAKGKHVMKASRETEELLQAIIKVRPE